MIVTALRKTRIDAYQLEGQSCLSENRSGEDVYKRQGQGFDALGVDGLQPFDQVEDAIELGLRVAALVRGQFDSGQLGNAGHILSLIHI